MIKKSKKGNYALSYCDNSNIHGFICKSCARFHMCIRSSYVPVFYFCLWPHLSTNFYLLVKLVNDCLSACSSSFVHLLAFVSLTSQLHREIWLWKNTPCASCNKYNNNLSQTTAGDLGLHYYIATFVICQSLCLHLERYWFHIIMVLCHWWFILVRPGVLFIRVS